MIFVNWFFCVLNLKRFVWIMIIIFVSNVLHSYSYRSLITKLNNWPCLFILEVIILMKNAAAKEYFLWSFTQSRLNSHPIIIAELRVRKLMKQGNHDWTNYMLQILFAYDSCTVIIRTICVNIPEISVHFII